jgi:hypothetical protein
MEQFLGLQGTYLGISGSFWSALVVTGLAMIYTVTSGLQGGKKSYRSLKTRNSNSHKLYSCLDGCPSRDFNLYSSDYHLCNCYPKRQCTRRA